MRKLLVKYLFLLFVGVALVSACGGDDKGGGSKADRPAKQKPKTVYSGKMVFQKYCVACHGVDGKLGLNGAKDFSLSELDLPQRVEMITNGKGLMTPFKDVLKKEEIQAVAEYTMELSKGD